MHRINRLEIELRANDPSFAQVLLDRVSRMHERQLSPLAERVFNELSGPETVHRIDTLEVDVGTISLDDFEADFCRKLEVALRAALSKALGRPNGNGFTCAAQELLEIFARTGNLPWWADSGDSDVVSAAIAILTAEAPTRMLTLLGALWDDALALRRLGRHVDDTSLLALIDCAWPTAGLTAQDELHGITRMLQRARAAGAAPASGNRASLLRELALALLARKDEGDAPADKLRRLMKAGARAWGLTEHELFAEVCRDRRGLELPSTEGERQSGVELRLPDEDKAVTIAHSLSAPGADAREMASPDVENRPDKPGLDTASRLKEVCSGFVGGRLQTEETREVLGNVAIRTGERAAEPQSDIPLESISIFSLPPHLPIAAGLISKASMSTSEAPGSLHPQLSEIAIEHSLERNFTPPSDDHEALVLLRENFFDRPSPDASAQSQSILMTPCQLSSLSQSDAATLATPDNLSAALAAGQRAAPNEDTARNTHPPALDAPMQHAPRFWSAAPRVNLRPELSADPHRALRRRVLARMDELYVEDAGLVILWPFLERLFKRLDLVDDKRCFINDASQMQAIAVLAVLAADDCDPIEFRLPLAKLLCGCVPEAGFALDQPLAPEQLEECARLLAVVIGHIPILKEMSAASLQANFLRRPGVLSTRDGAWLLQVERRVHDVVLERFPWSWEWIKLPWMSEPLRVEW